MIDPITYESWVLIALGASPQGMAKRRQALDAIENRFGHLLGPDDWGYRRDGEIVWRSEASFARNRLVYKGLVEQRALFGWGTWALTPRGAAKAAALQPDLILCPSFRLAALEASDSLRRGWTVGLAPGETTLTDNALLDLASDNGASMRIQRFTQSQEGRNGADWEWWIRDRHGCVGFRMQAKRVNPSTGRVALDQLAAKSLRPFFHRQIDAFAQRCKLDGIAGLYCVYGDAQAVAPDASAGHCPHGPANSEVWGCAILLTSTAMRLADEKTLDAATVLGAGSPWHRLVCHGPAAVSPTASVLTTFDSMGEAEREALREARQRRDVHVADPPADLAIGPPPATEPPEGVSRYFEQWDGPIEHPSSDVLAGVVLIDALRGRDVGSPANVLR